MSLFHSDNPEIQAELDRVEEEIIRHTEWHLIDGFLYGDTRVPSPDCSTCQRLEEQKKQAGESLILRRVDESAG